MAIIQERLPGPKFKNGNILFQRIPKPLYGMTVRSLMGTEFWNKEKTRSKIKNNYCCWACGINASNARFHQRLEAASVFSLSINDRCMIYNGAASLCYLCNCAMRIDEIFRGIDKGVFDYSFYEEVRIHCKIVTGSIVFPDTKIISVEDWQEWNLQINGVKYFSKFKTEKDFDIFYSNQRDQKNGN